MKKGKYQTAPGNSGRIEQHRHQPLFDKRKSLIGSNQVFGIHRGLHGLLFKASKRKTKRLHRRSNGTDLRLLISIPRTITVFQGMDDAEGYHRRSGPKLWPLSTGASSTQAIRALRLQRGNEVMRRGHAGALSTVQFEWPWKEAKAVKYEKRALEMAQLEAEEMQRLGTPYRQETARYVSQFFSERVNAGKGFDLSPADMEEELRSKYSLDLERVNDVSKSIRVLLARARDEDRLAEHYEQAIDKMKERDADRTSQ